eukprot:gene7128-11291_t
MKVQQERDWKVIKQAFYFLLFILSPFFLIYYGIGGHYFHLYSSAAWSILALIWYFPVLYHVTIHNFLKILLNYHHSKDLLYISLDENIKESATKFERILYFLKHLFLGIHTVLGILLCFIAFICLLIQRDFIGAFFAFFILFIIILWEFYCFKSIKMTNNLHMNTFFKIYSIFIILLGVSFSITIVTITAFPTLHIFRSVINDFDNPPPGVLFNVMGHKMHLNCIGNGSPTILFEHGYSGSSLDWSHIQPIVSNVTRTCSYDRAGYGWSDMGIEPRDSEHISTELKTLLDEAKINDDLILVGHSFAGILMKAFKNISKNKILGVVLVDAVNSDRVNPQGLNHKNPARPLFDFARNVCPIGVVDFIFDFGLGPGNDLDLIRKLPNEMSEKYLKNLKKCKIYQPMVSEWMYFGRSAAQVKGIDFGDIPLFNFPSGRGLNTTELVGLSSNSRMIHFVDADHYTPFNSTYSKIIAGNVIKMIEESRK